MKKEVNIFPGNESYVDSFVYNLYGSPISWGGGSRLIIKGYPEFDIKAEKGFFDKDYKTKIIFGDSISKDEMQYLAKLASTRNLSFSDVDKIIDEAKKNLSYKFRELRA